MMHCLVDSYKCCVHGGPGIQNGPGVTQEVSHTVDTGVETSCVARTAEGDFRLKVYRPVYHINNSNNVRIF